MTCDLCGKKKATIKRVSKSFGKGKDLILIENIPFVRCSDCGESYFTASTLHEVERIKTHRRDLAAKKAVAVASFGKSAA